jgi:hypothetical protein
MYNRRVLELVCKILASWQKRERTEIGKSRGTDWGAIRQIEKLFSLLLPTQIVEILQGNKPRGCPSRSYFI